MKQIIHIFRKDLRQHWVMILLSLAAFVALAWDEPRHWLPFGSDLNRFRWVPIVLVLSLWSLVIRVVQGEALAGDRQYWITRPIEWKKLLAAKVLFVATFASAPLLIVDLYLLTRAGFRPTPAYATGLLWRQLVWAGILLLTVAALAAATSNLGQMIMAVAAVGIVIAGTAFLSDYLPDNRPSDVPDDLQAAVAIGACCTVVIWQYARRKTGRSRMILAGAAALMSIIVLATPYFFPVSFEYALLRTGEQPPVQLSLDPARPPSLQVVPYEERVVNLEVPLRVSDIGEDSVIQVDGTMLVFEGKNGQQWKSGWQRGYSTLLPDAVLTQEVLHVKKSFLENVTGKAVTAHVSLALTVSRDENPRRAIATTSNFAVPGVGLCRLARGYSPSLFCLFPLHGPALTVVEVPVSRGPCWAGDSDWVTRGKIFAWGGNTDSGPFTPVGIIDFHFPVLQDPGAHPRICASIPLAIRLPQVIRRVRMEVELRGVRWGDYQRRGSFTFPLRSSTTP